jgi:acyl dehydratase
MGRVFSEFHVGQRFITPGRTITENDIVNFAGLTGDYNPLHTDESFSASTNFGTRIAHGPMGIGIAFGLASRLDLIDGTIVALLGVTWDFCAPVRIGDTIRAMIEVVGKRNVKDPERGIVEMAISILNQDDVTAQTGSACMLLRRSQPIGKSWGMISPRVEAAQ